MFLFGPPNIEKMKQKRDVKGLIKALSYRKDAAIQRSAAEKLVQIGAPAVEPLIAALASNDQSVRMEVTDVLARIGSPAREPMNYLLKDCLHKVAKAAHEGNRAELSVLQSRLLVINDVWSKLFHEEETTLGADDIVARGVPGESLEEMKSLSSKIFDQFEAAKGVDDLHELIRTRRVEELEDLCSNYPLESLQMEVLYLEDCRKTELLIAFAQTLLHYNQTLEKEPHLNLPKTLPAQKLLSLLLPKILQHLSNNKGNNIAEGLRIRIYDLALSLMEFAKDREALECLLVSRPSIKEDHEFWLAACFYNIAYTSKNPDDLMAAKNHLKQIVDGKISIPEKYQPGIAQIIQKIEKL